MPFIISMIGKARPDGRLVIDRDNLIFEFTPQKGKSERAEEKRERFSSLFRQAVQPKLVARSSRDFTENQELHQIVDHMADVDFKAYHAHLKFKSDVTAQDMTDVFKLLKENSPPGVLDEFMLPGNLKDIEYAVQQYFHSLANEEGSKKIEHQYREEKNRKFEETRASERVKEESRPKPSMPEIEVITPDEFMMALVMQQSLMNPSFLTSVLAQAFGSSETSRRNTNTRGTTLRATVRYGNITIFSTSDDVILPGPNQGTVTSPSVPRGRNFHI